MFPSKVSWLHEDDQLMDFIFADINIDLAGDHPAAMRFGCGFGLRLAQGKAMIAWACTFRYNKDQVWKGLPGCRTPCF